MFDLANELGHLTLKFPRARITIQSILSSEGVKWWVQIIHKTYHEGPGGRYQVEFSDVQFTPHALAQSVREIHELLLTEKDLV